MIAAVFPGQGSQKPGMGKALFDTFASARNVFDRVQSATGVDIASICFESDEETLRQTQNAQLALYTCGMAAYGAFRIEAPEVSLAMAAGHSVGEYAAIAASGIVSLEDGAQLVLRRGELMSRVGNLRAGSMAAVIGLERTLLEEACQEASTVDEVVVVANDNSPGQLVVSGDRAAVERLSATATAKGARRVLPLNVSGAFHSPLMEEPAEAMGEALRTKSFAEGEYPVVANVTAQPVSAPDSWPDMLVRQLKSPVRWTESVQWMRQAGVQTFLEFGSGEVLGGLIRRIDAEAICLAIAEPIGLAAAKEALAGVKVEA